MLLTRRGSGTRANAAAKLRGETVNGRGAEVVGAPVDAVDCMALSCGADRRFRHAYPLIRRVLLLPPPAHKPCLQIPESSHAPDVEPSTGVTGEVQADRLDQFAKRELVGD